MNIARTAYSLEYLPAGCLAGERPRAGSPCHGRRSGFTLVEMLIVAGITILMIGVVNIVFRDAGRMVALGVANSDVLSTGRAVGEQISRDAALMVGPDTSEGGFLLILNRTIPNVPVTEDDAQQLGFGEPANVRDVRSDQLVFIRSRGTMEPIAPGQTNVYSNSSSAPFVKMWYGHVERTGRDGFEDVGRLGQAGPSLPGPNQLAIQWVLGRQAMFLDGDNNQVKIHTDQSNGGPWPDWRVQAYSNIEPWFLAGSDVLDKDLTDIVGPGDEDDRLRPTDDDATYAQEALKYAYDDPLTDGDRSLGRLRVNPTPDMRVGAMETWQVAQMHPYFAAFVSDFIVEFAADTTNNPADPNHGKVDVYPAGHEKEGQIIWYGLSEDDEDEPDFNNGLGIGQTGDPVHEYERDEGRATFVFRHDDDGSDSNWPHLIRIRYRMHDARNRIGMEGEGGRWFEQVIRVQRP